MSRTSTRFAAMLAVVVVAFPLHAQPLATESAAIRRELTAVNATWSRIRLTYDRTAADSLLTPDFYVALRDSRVTRDEFLARISAQSPTAKLVRFDNPILTITKGDSTNEWVALVQEKFEYDRVAADGSKSRTYHLWITRDGFRRTATGGWQFMYSQEVMREAWTNGTKPPFADWDRKGLP